MTVKLDINSRGRVSLVASWRPGLPDKCKSIEGAAFSKTTRSWSYPKTMHTLRRLRSVFGDELVVSDELNAWARGEVRRERSLARLAQKSTTTLTEVPRLAPRLATAMLARPYQTVGARFGAVAENRWLLADEPGLGKTVTALASLMEGGLWSGTHLICAPKVSLSSVWARQTKMWTGASVVAMPEGAARREDAWEYFQYLAGKARRRPVFLAVNPAMLQRVWGNFCPKCKVWKEDLKKDPNRAPAKHWSENHRYRRELRTEWWPQLFEQEWQSVILDESHELLAGYKPSNVTQSVQGLLDLKTNGKIALTGTPLRGREVNIWGTLAWLRPDMYSGYWGWVKEFFDTQDFKFGIEVGPLRADNAKSFYSSIDRFVLRRTKMEVRPDLPVGQRVDHLVEMSPKQRKTYDEFVEQGETDILNGTISTQGLLSELTRQKQFAFGLWENVGGKLRLRESPVIDLLLQMLRERGVSKFKTETWFPERKDAGYKYVIASPQMEILDAVKQQLDKNKILSLSITGAVNKRSRDEAQAIFQSPDRQYRVMLLNTRAGGYSIELDAWCDEMFILDETWIADDQKQLEGRIDNRSGRIAPRTFHYIRVADTIQQRIADGNWTQQDVQHKLLDGRRGVELALHLMTGKNNV